jgi:hypothetical protein
VLRQPWAAAAAALVLAVYLAVLSAMPKEGFWSPDEGAKFIQLHTVSWRGGLRFAIPYGGQHVDPDFAFYPTRCRFEDLYPAPLADGGVKLHWPIWFPLGSGLLASVLGPTGLYVVPLLSGWLVALLAGHLMRAWEARLAPLAILAVGLATPVAFFSLTFWEHTLATLLALAALAIVAADRRRTATLWLAVLLLLAAAALRMEMLLFAAAVACAWLVARRTAPTTPAGEAVPRRGGRALWIALGVALTIGLVLVFGEAIPERHRWILSVLPASLVGTVGKLPYLAEIMTAVLVDAPGNQSPVVPQLLRYAVLTACAAMILAALLRSWRAEAIVLLTALAVIVEFSIYLVVRPGAFISLHGFLPIAPVIVLAPYVFLPAWRRRRHAQVAIVAAAAAYALLAFAAILVVVARPDGVVPTGLEWGNRYLFTLYPLGVVLALAALDEYRRSARPLLLRQVVSAAAAALLLCGVLLEVRGVWMLVETRRLVTVWQAALRDGPPVMTDVWWLPAAMAPLFTTHAVHCVRHTEDLVTWFPVALAHGVDTFTFASFQSLDAAQMQHDGFSVDTEPEQVVSGLHLRRVRIAAAAPAP